MTHHVPKDVLNIVKSFYPEGLDYDRDFQAYINTDEYKRHDAQTSAFHREAVKWHSRVEAINQDCNTHFQPIMPNHNDRCLSFQWKQSDDIALLLEFSALGPYFGLLMVTRQYSGQTSTPSDITSLAELRAIVSQTDYTIDYNLRRILDEGRETRLVRMISDRYNIDRIPGELMEVELSGLNFDKTGRPLTLYHALFQGKVTIL